MLVAFDEKRFTKEQHFEHITAEKIVVLDRHGPSR
jgi:hypothetical protein